MASELHKAVARAVEPIGANAVDFGGDALA
jgi:hypothetical protein